MRIGKVKYHHARVHNSCTSWGSDERTTPRKSTSWAWSRCMHIMHRAMERKESYPKQCWVLKPLSARPCAVGLNGKVWSQWPGHSTTIRWSWSTTSIDERRAGLGALDYVLRERHGAAGGRSMKGKKTETSLSVPEKTYNHLQAKKTHHIMTIGLSKKYWFVSW